MGYTPLLALVYNTLNRLLWQNLTSTGLSMDPICRRYRAGRWSNMVAQKAPPPEPSGQRLLDNGLSFIGFDTWLGHYLDAGHEAIGRSRCGECLGLSGSISYDRAWNEQS
jgi:hypothetical protein